ncbi:MAG: hypothetical protein WCF65_07105 [Parachlamydiaceae bacterium]
MTSLVSAGKSKKDQRSTSQKTFDRLRAKIKSMQTKLDKTEKALNIALNFHYQNITPIRTKLSEVLSEFTEILYNHFKENKKISRRDLNVIESIIISKIKDIVALTSFNNIPPKIKSIMEELEGVSFKDTHSEELADLKDFMSDLFEGFDVDLDLSDVKDTDDQETIMRKMFQAISEAKENQSSFDSNTCQEKPKSKKEQQKEIKEKELETLQKKGLGTIYKTLAKCLHPDLEQDPILKLEKEGIMKRLTTAYENTDLHELLSIEIEWMSRTESEKNQTVVQSDDQFKIYNSILKDQIVDLEMELSMVHMHPKYMPISAHFSDDVSMGMFRLNEALADLKQDLAAHRSVIKDLQSRDAMSMIRLIIQTAREL